MKKKLSTEWLSVCGGCHVAIVDLHNLILNMLDYVEILRCPVLTDIKDYPHADIGLLAGAIRSEHDRKAALKMRKSCKTLIAFGTCAVYGGISGAGCLHSKGEVFDTVYKSNVSTLNNGIVPDPGNPDMDIPHLEDTVVPVDKVEGVKVDFYIPGCPPHPYFIARALSALITGRVPATDYQTVCTRCKREMKQRKDGDRAIKRFTQSIDDKEKEKTCFLSQGYLCFGSVTVDRCYAPCPQKGMICTGCCGPTDQILREPNRDIRIELAEQMALLTSIKDEDIDDKEIKKRVEEEWEEIKQGIEMEPEEFKKRVEKKREEIKEAVEKEREEIKDGVIKEIEKYSKTHYAYAMATEMIGKKPTFLIRKWIRDAHSRGKE